MYSLDISVDITWNIVMENLKDTMETRRKERLHKGPTIPPPKKITTSPQIKMPEWYKAPNYEEKQSLKKKINEAREKIKASKEAENNKY